MTQKTDIILRKFTGKLFIILLQVNNYSVQSVLKKKGVLGANVRVAWPGCHGRTLLRWGGGHVLADT